KTEAQNALGRERVALTEKDAALGEKTVALTERTAALENAGKALGREQRIAYVRGLGLVEQEWFANNLHRADQVLELCQPVALSADGGAVAAISQSLPKANSKIDYRVNVWDTVTRRELFSLSADDWNYDSLTFSPDGKSLAVASCAVETNRPTGGITHKDF